MRLTTFYHVTAICLQILSILFFSQGFFMAREYLPDINLVPTLDQQEKIKVVLILFDSFRTDLALDTNFPFVERIQRENPNRTLFYLAIADSPTATVQRLQALTSGNLPSFINLKANFDAEEMQEDNIIWQLKRANKISYYLGDDIWDHLFPKYFEKIDLQNFFDDNEADYKTMDDNILKNIFPNLQDTGWDLILTHISGLDHAAHDFGRNSNEVQYKLIQYSKFLDDLYEKIDNSTILLVIGDHGMIESGNHGGNSDEETNTILFATYKGDKVFFKDFKFGVSSLDIKNSNEQIQAFLKDSYHHESPIINQSQYVRKISQIDLVPTLANILNISIPYSNLGMYIPEFTLKNQDEVICFYIQALQLNSLQKFQRSNLSFGSDYPLYLEGIKSISKISRSAFGKLDGIVSKLQIVIQKKHKFTFYYNKQESYHALEVSALIYDIQTMARKVWNEYDETLMKLSIVMFLLMFALAFQVTKFFYHARETQQNQQLYQIHQFNDIQDKSTIEDILSIGNFVRGALKNYRLIIFFVWLTIVLYLFSYVKFNQLFCLSAQVVSFYLIYDVQTRIRILQDQREVNLGMAEADGNIADKIDEKNGFYQQGFFSLIMFFMLKVGHSWILLAFSYMQVEDQSLFWVLSFNLTIFVLVDLIYRLINDRKNLSIPKKMIYLLITISGLFLAEQYDSKNLNKYLRSFLYKEQLVWLFHNAISGILLPSLILQLQLGWIFTYQQFKKDKYSFLRSLTHLNLLIVCIYHGLEFSSIYSIQADYFTIYIPRIIYILSLANIGLTVVFIKNAKREFISIQFLSPLLLTTGWPSLAVFAIFFITVYALFKLLQHSTINNRPYFFFGCLAILTNYFWFMLGNRCQLSAIQVERGKIGFPKINFYLSGSILILNQFNFHFVGVLLVPIISDILVIMSFNNKMNKSESDQKLENKNSGLIDYIIYLVSRRFCMMLFQSHFMVQMMITAINCYYNRYRILLTGNFAPKFLFDAFIFVCVSITSLFV